MNDIDHQSRVADSSYSSLEELLRLSKDVLDERSSLKKALRNLSSLLSLLSQLLASNSSKRPFPRGTAVKALGVFLACCCSSI